MRVTIHINHRKPFVPESLDLDDIIIDLNGECHPTSVPPTPATKPKRSKRRTRFEDEDEDDTSEDDDFAAKVSNASASAAQMTASTNARSGRASKIAALNKITSASRTEFKIDEGDENEEDCSESSDSETE